jgi:hypothetical protein
MRFVIKNAAADQGNRANEEEQESGHFFEKKEVLSCLSASTRLPWAADAWNEAAYPVGG